MRSDNSDMTETAIKNKTVATWLAFIFGQLGLHRFYLFGAKDALAWLHPLAAALGWWGVLRMRTLGQDDKLAWVLLPILGVLIAATAVTAIYYGLCSSEKWNGTHNQQQPESPAGNTNWLVIVAVAFSLLMGATALMASLAFTFQRYFEIQQSQ